MANIEHSQLTEMLRYNPQTGDFTWLVTRGAAKAGMTAGNVVAEWYVRIEIFGKQYMAHRLVWFYVNNEWPENDIDHINRNRCDNRFSNLRIASKSQNQANRPIHPRSTIGLKGVRHSSKSMFAARIKINKKFIHLGTFSCPAAAHFAYQIAADKHFGEFANVA